MAAGQGNAFLVDSVSSGSSATSSTTEGDYAIFTVDLSGNDIDTIVSLGFNSDSATKGADFSPDLESSFDRGKTWTPVPANGQLPVAAGIRSFQVRTLTLIDNIFEGNEIFGLFASTGRSRSGSINIFDKPAVSKFVSVSDASAVEGQQEVFTVSLSETTVAPTTVQLTLSSASTNVSLSPYGATIGNDFSQNMEASFDGGKTWTPVPANGQLAVLTGIKDFQVRTEALLDSFLENQNEIFGLTATVNGENASGTGTIIDRPLNTPKVISVSNTSANEGEAEVFIVGLSDRTFEPTNIQFNLASGTAILGKDFSATLEASFDDGVTWSSVPTNGQLTLGGGVQDFQVRTITLIDNQKEATETFILTASSNGGTANGTGLIRDVPIPVKVNSVSNARAIEGDKEVFTIGLSDKTTAPTTVELNLASGTATLGTDFSATLEASFDRGKTWTEVPRNGKLEVGTGIKNFQVRTMTTIDPLLKEGKETFKLTASANGGTADGTGTIIDKRFIGAIAIDLNGDGIQTLSIDKGVKFDITNSGEKLSTGWISNVDAFLAFDKNGNGKIDSRAELFGGGVGQGFAKLDSFDSDRDGLVNAQDARFDKLKVWQDKNSNGMTDCNELFSLSDVGIVSLKVAYTSDFTLDAQQNVLGERSLVTTNTGKTLELVGTYFPVASSFNFLSTLD